MADALSAGRAYFQRQVRWSAWEWAFGAAWVVAFFVPQANPGKATTSLTIASRGKGKGTGPVKFTISGGGDSVTTSASLTVKQVKKKKPKRNRR